MASISFSAFRGGISSKLCALLSAEDLHHVDPLLEVRESTLQLLVRDRTHKHGEIIVNRIAALIGLVGLELTLMTPVENIDVSPFMQIENLVEILAEVIRLKSEFLVFETRELKDRSQDWKHNKMLRHEVIGQFSTLLEETLRAVVDADEFRGEPRKDVSGKSMSLFSKEPRRASFEAFVLIADEHIVALGHDLYPAALTFDRLLTTRLPKNHGKAQRDALARLVAGIYVNAR